MLLHKSSLLVGWEDEEEVEDEDEDEDRDEEEEEFVAPMRGVRVAI